MTSTRTASKRVRSARRSQNRRPTTSTASASIRSRTWAVTAGCSVRRSPTSPRRNGVRKRRPKTRGYFASESTNAFSDARNGDGGDGDERTHDTHDHGGRKQAGSKIDDGQMLDWPEIPGDKKKRLKRTRCAGNNSQRERERGNRRNQSGACHDAGRISRERQAQHAGRTKNEGQ